MILKNSHHIKTDYYLKNIMDIFNYETVEIVAPYGGRWRSRSQSIGLVLRCIAQKKIWERPSKRAWNESRNSSIRRRLSHVSLVTTLSDRRIIWLKLVAMPLVLPLSPRHWHSLFKARHNGRYERIPSVTARCQIARDYYTDLIIYYWKCSNYIFYMHML